MVKIDKNIPFNGVLQQLSFITELQLGHPCPLSQTVQHLCSIHSNAAWLLDRSEDGRGTPWGPGDQTFRKPPFILVQFVHLTSNPAEV